MAGRPERQGTPLGPGGAPFARWRPMPLIVALAVSVPTVFLMLSDRAPGWLRRFGSLMATTSPRTARAVQDSPFPDDISFLAHVGVWAVAAVFVVLIAWSWRSVAVGLVLIVAAGVAIEIAQGVFTDVRSAQVRDVQANVIGVTLGAVVGVGVWAVIARPDRR